MAISITQGELKQLIQDAQTQKKSVIDTISGLVNAGQFNDANELLQLAKEIDKSLQNLDPLPFIGDDVSGLEDEVTQLQANLQALEEKVNTLDKDELSQETVYEEDEKTQTLLLLEVELFKLQMAKEKVRHNVSIFGVVQDLIDKINEIQTEVEKIESGTNSWEIELLIGDELEEADKIIQHSQDVLNFINFPMEQPSEPEVKKVLDHPTSLREQIVAKLNALDPIPQALKMNELLQAELIHLYKIAAQPTSINDELVKQIKSIEDSMAELNNVIKNKQSDEQLLGAVKSSVEIYTDTQLKFPKAEIKSSSVSPPPQETLPEIEKKESKIPSETLPEKIPPKKKIKLREEKLSLNENIKSFVNDVKEQGIKKAVAAQLDKRRNNKLEKIWNNTKGDDFSKVFALLSSYANVDIYFGSGGKPSFFNPTDWTKEHMTAVSRVLREHKLLSSDSSDETPRERNVEKLLNQIIESVNNDGKELNPNGELNAIIKLIEAKCGIDPQELEVAPKMRVS